MGALHDGHLTLVRTAKRRGLKVVVSIFVNPTQFAPNEDFASYPRTMDADLDKLAAEAADLVWAPTAAVMYPQGFATRIAPEGPAVAGLEDKFRPHFFGGVATVVGKLFNQCRPDFAMFGEKDYQQLKVVTRMAQDLDMRREGDRRADGTRAGRPRAVVAQRLPVRRRAPRRAGFAADDEGRSGKTSRRR